MMSVTTSLKKSKAWIELGIAAALILGVILSRLPWQISLLNNFDAVNYALAVDKFDVRFHQTQPPGYYLYIVGVRVVNLFTGDAVAALAAFSTLASGLGIYFLYLAGRELFGRRTGLIAAVLLGVSTTFWYQGEIAAPYTGDLALSALVAWLCLRARTGGNRRILLAAFFLGVCGAYRPQSMFFLGPLLLYGLWGRSWKLWLTSGLLAGITAAVLFVPAILDSGGLKAYLTEVLQLANTTTAEHQATYGSIRYLGYVLTTLLITFKAVGETLWIFVFAGMWAARHQKAESLFLFLWFIPTWLVFCLLYPGNPGTILVCVPPFFLWAARSFEAALKEGRWQKPAWVALGALLIWQVILFVALPDDILLYRQVDNANRLARDEARIRAYLDVIAELPVEKTKIFAVNFRHIQYYLPEYLACTKPRSSAKQPTLLHLVICTQNGKAYTYYGIPTNELIAETTRYVAFLDISPADLPASAAWMQPHTRRTALGDEVTIWVIEIPEGQHTNWTPDGLVLEP